MKTYLLSGAFWTGSVERAVKAFSWTLASLLAGPDLVDSVGVDLLNVGWRDALSFAAGAGLLSILGSVGSGNFTGPQGSPSLVNDRP